MSPQNPAPNTFNTAARPGQTEAARWGQELLTELGKGRAPQADKAKMLDLIARGASVSEVNEHGQTALMVAIHYGRNYVAQRILAAGASVHAKDHKDNTPLIWCGYMGNSDLALSLLRAGAKPDDCNSIGRNMLTQAAGKGHDDFLKTMIARGCDPDLADRRGETPLTTAAAAGRKATCLALISAGANPVKPASSGKTAAETAREARYTTVADAIEKTIEDCRERILRDDIRQITDGVREDITLSTAPIKTIRKRQRPGF